MDTFFDYGTCCICEQEIEDPVLLSLSFKIHVESETKWGCYQCGLPNEGAVAVICDDCFDEDDVDFEDKIKYLMNGGRGRIPVPPVEDRIPHECDLSLHPEVGEIYDENTV